MTRISYLVASFFIVYALLMLAFQFHLIADVQTPQRIAVLKLVTYWTPISIYLIAGVTLALARYHLWIYTAGFAASLPAIYQLWANVLQPVLLPDLSPNYLALVLYLFLLVLLPIGARREVLQAKVLFNANLV
jgi:hypothetical protein